MRALVLPLLLAASLSAPVLGGGPSPDPRPANTSPLVPAASAHTNSTTSTIASTPPRRVQSKNHAPLFAARTLNATGPSRVTLSLR